MKNSVDLFIIMKFKESETLETFIEKGRAKFISENFLESFGEQR